MSRHRSAGSVPRQTPYKRTYPDGRAVWISRYRDLSGKRRYAKPRWNGSRSTFTLKGDAQRAIDEALEQQHGISIEEPKQIATYFEDWLSHHPRSPRTDKTYTDRINCVLGIEIEGRALGEWYFDELRRRHVHLLVDHILREQGRSAEGTRGLIRPLSAMAEDAISDDAAQTNPFLRIRLRRNDPRIQKPPRRVRIWSFEQMREFATGGRPEVRARTPRPPDPRNRGRYHPQQRFYPSYDYEALLLTPGLTGMRLGEFLALRRSDFHDGVISFDSSVHEGERVGSSDQKNHERTVPVPPTLACLLETLLEDSDSELLFPSPRGHLWREANFYREVWAPAKIATGMDPTPHEFRHSYVTQLRAAGIDDADLAKVAGHQVQTMISVYTHALERSHDAIRDVIG